MQRYASSRFIGSCVIAGMPLTFVVWATLEFLRKDYSPFRNLLNDYLVGPYSILGTAAACMLAATFLGLLVGLRLSVRPTAFLTASCVLLAVVVISLCMSAVFPIEPSPSNSTRLAFAWAGVVHMFSAVRIYALLMALLLTLPMAFQRDENWRPLSHVTLALGLLILASGVALILAPLSVRGLVQRGTALVILAWLVLTAMRLRRIVSSPQGTAA